jgi:hypothetical protein
MRRKILGATALLALVGLAACSETTGPQSTPLVSLASGSGGGGTSTGGGGGGGGGGGTARPCGILSYAILNDIVTKTVVPSFWAPNSAYLAIASGTAEKSCDLAAGATIVFEDITGINDGCDVKLTPWVNNPAYLNPKYGAKPMSRYQETFIYYTGADCVGRSRVLKATLTDPSPGGTTSSVTLNWTP